MTGSKTQKSETCGSFAHLGIKNLLHPRVGIAFSVLSQGTLATGPHTFIHRDTNIRASPFWSSTMMSVKLTVGAFFSLDSIAICSLNGNLKAMLSAHFSRVSVVQMSS